MRSTSSCACASSGTKPTLSLRSMQSSRRTSACTTAGSLGCARRPCAGLGQAVVEEVDAVPQAVVVVVTADDSVSQDHGGMRGRRAVVPANDQRALHRRPWRSCRTRWFQTPSRPRALGRARARRTEAAKSRPRLRKVPRRDGDKTYDIRLAAARVVAPGIVSQPMHAGSAAPLRGCGIGRARERAARIMGDPRRTFRRTQSSTTSTTSKTPETCSFSTNAERRSTRWFSAASASPRQRW